MSRLDSIIPGGRPFGAVRLIPLEDSAGYFRLLLEPGPHIDSIAVDLARLRHTRAYLVEQVLRDFTQYKYLVQGPRVLEQGASQADFLDSLRVLSYHRKEDPDGDILVFTLSAAGPRTLQADGGITYTGGENTSFIGEGRVQLHNILRRGEQGSLAYFSDGERSDARLDVSVPHVFDTPFGIKTAVSMELQGQEYSFIQYEGGMTVPRYAGGRSISLSATGYELQKKDLRRVYRGIAVGGEAAREQFERGRKAFRADFAAQSGVTRSEDERRIRAELSAAASGQVSPFSVPAAFYSGLDLRHIAYSDYSRLTAPELFRVGGDESLRGYPRQSFVFSSLILVRSELRWYFTQKNRFYILADGVSGSLGSVRPEEFRSHIGYGGGISLVRREMRFTLEWATHRNNPISAGFIHVGITH
ncbi:MAG: hypothetical protein ACQEQV_03955 [Fibrobacterota bacterium]